MYRLDAYGRRFFESPRYELIAHETDDHEKIAHDLEKMTADRSEDQNLLQNLKDLDKERAQVVKQMHKIRCVSPGFIGKIGEALSTNTAEADISENILKSFFPVFEKLDKQSIKSEFMRESLNKSRELMNKYLTEAAVIPFLAEALPEHLMIHILNLAKRS